MDTSRPVGNLSHALLELMYNHGFVKWNPEPFTLKSGKRSHVYVFGREDITDNPNLLYMLGGEIRKAVQSIFEKLTLPDDPRIPCIIGIPTAGTPLAQAAAMVRFFEPEWDPRKAWNICTKLCFRVMREVQKKHGAHNGWVNGAPDTEKHFYCAVDNVVTDGASKVEAAKRLLEDGYPAYGMPQIILVAREWHVVEELKKRGFKQVIVLFTLRDIINGFKERGYWTPEMAGQALAEFSD
ncbi:MAG: hypothetical protein HYS73_01515 [Parcubacteria group bacterium]|nr:hypothetical protein [Parcubacteria group bacterium]